MVIFVDVESPYSGKDNEEVARNIRYARACVRDCLLRGEVPFASHLFYTQSGILDDNIPKEREMGIWAGKSIIEKLNADSVVYTDLGISKGMLFGIKMAEKRGRTIKYKTLGKDWEEKLRQVEKDHSHNGLWDVN